ncbi:MAG: hypothetical protein MI799_02360, partial [Desulfobacterales bacterium]|nr:hypothetical protein [Desulfobacterales bacterium]
MILGAFNICLRLKINGPLCTQQNFQVFVQALDYVVNCFESASQQSYHCPYDQSRNQGDYIRLFFKHPTGSIKIPSPFEE